MNPEKKQPDVEELVLNELEKSDWDLSSDSLEAIAHRLRGHFPSYQEALDFVYAMVSSMFDVDLGKGRMPK
ncbi:MAG: hypothetical protein ACETWC_02015 [Acidobacteriota bacterium]